VPSGIAPAEGVKGKNEMPHVVTGRAVIAPAGTRLLGSAAPQSQEEQDQIQTLEILTAQQLQALPVSTALGLCFSYILLACETGKANRDRVRRCLNEPIIKQGFRGESLLRALLRVGK
jgi:hypothetical protein